MASPDQVFASGYLPRLLDLWPSGGIDPAAVGAMAGALRAFGDATSSLASAEPADFAPVAVKVPLPRVTLVPPDGMPARSARDASRRDRLKRNAAVVAFAWLYVAVPAETVDRAAGWAAVIALLVVLHDRLK